MDNNLDVKIYEMEGRESLKVQGRLDCLDEVAKLTHLKIGDDIMIASDLEDLNWYTYTIVDSMIEFRGEIGKITSFHTLNTGRISCTLDVDDGDYYWDTALLFVKDEAIEIENVDKKYTLSNECAKPYSGADILEMINSGDLANGDMYSSTLNANSSVISKKQYIVGDGKVPEFYELLNSDFIIDCQQERYTLSDAIDIMIGHDVGIRNKSWDLDADYVYTIYDILQEVFYMCDVDDVGVDALEDHCWVIEE